LCPVRAECRRGIVRWIISKPCLAGAVGIHSVNLIVAVAVGSESDPAVAAECGNYIECCVVSETRLVTSVRTHDINFMIAIAIRFESDKAIVSGGSRTDRCAIGRSRCRT